MNLGVFTKALDAFLASLPMGWTYGIEISNSEYLVDDYLSMLRAHHVAHEFNACTRMPALEAQTAHEENFTADFILSRVLLRVRRTYENAVKEFEPYDRIQDPNQPGREALRGLIDGGRGRSEPTFIYVNNRFEGNAPETIRAILDSSLDS